MQRAAFASNPFPAAVTPYSRPDCLKLLDTPITSTTRLSKRRSPEKSASAIFSVASPNTDGKARRLVSTPTNVPVRAASPQSAVEAATGASRAVAVVRLPGVPDNAVGNPERRQQPAAGKGGLRRGLRRRLRQGFCP